MSWGRFISSPAAGDHAVQVYAQVDELAASVAAFFAAGFDVGAPAVAIATPLQWQACAKTLGTRGVDVAALEADGLLVVRDARETLAAVRARGLEAVVGPVLDELQERSPSQMVRAFGSMVDLLWQEHRREAALALELEWNALQQTRTLALLCGYHADVFDVDVQQGLAPVFHAHTHARPVTDTVRLSAALDAALGETLAADNVARVYLNAADQVPHGGVPRAQAVIGHLVEHDARTAATVLGRARAYYAD
jgi:hypothetical protein